MANNNDFETIKPTEIPLTQPPSATRSQPKKFPQRLIVGSWLALVVLLALAVVFVLPKLVEPTATLPNTSQPASKTTDSEAANASTPPETPWRDAQLAKARREAQDILAKLLERQQFLENKSVQRWAPERFQQGLDQAAEGDKTFRERQFNDALTHYQQALTTFTELEQQANQTLTDTLAAGLAAIDAGDVEKARQQFELALAIQPGNANATQGLARTDTLPDVLALIKQAEQARQEQLLVNTRSLLQQAVKLDGQHQVAQQQLAATEQAIVEQNYIAALSRGYQQLEQGKLTAAKQAFRQALALKPNDSDAQTGLNQASTQQSQQTLQQQLQTASQREQQESWRAAETLYNQILRNDSSVVAARVGQLRSKARADLDDTLQELIDKPLRLSSSNVFQEGQRALKEAREITPKGERLNNQIASLQTVLIKASTPWPIELTSDNNTQVTLFRVGELGRFSSKTVKLKPGRYIASGTRKGYRDVRVEFVVTGANSRGPIAVQCRDLI